MYSPVTHAVSSTMSKNKNKNAKSTKSRAVVVHVKQPAGKSGYPTPYTDAGGRAGQYVGGMVPLPFASIAGKHIGRFLGAGIGSIVGSGDYTTTGPSPSYNVLNGQIPKFVTGRATNIVSHREYLGDINGATAFTNRSYPLNPGMSVTFPWLSTLAQSYQQYRFHGLVFEFRSLVTDFVTSGAPGVIVMTTNYNADRPAFSSRIEAENAEYAVSVKPTLSLMHMIECATNETQNKIYNVRSGPVDADEDLKFYDVGLTQIITQNNPSQVLGELWVSYVVEFLKPQLPSAIGSYSAASYSVYRSGIAAASPLGTASVVVEEGNLADSVSLTANTITIVRLIPGAVYKLDIFTDSVATATIAIAGTTSISGAVAFNASGNAGVGNNIAQTATTGLASNQSALFLFFRPTDPTVVLTFSLGGVYPAAPVFANIDINLTDIVA